jgi:hypothetical protein
VSGHNITVQLDETAMLATFNATYAQLSNSNSFTGSQSIKGGLSLTAGLTAQSSAVTGYSTAVEGFKSNGAIVATPASLATSTAAQDSPQLQLGASAYNSGSAAAVAQTYAWQTQVSGNDTASPTANLALLFGSGTGPAATGLSIASNGAINFSPHQTFPITGTGGGTITGITTTSPLTGSGTAGSVALGLNTAALETTLNGVYPPLTGNASFTGYIEGNHSAGPDSAAVLGFGTSQSTGSLGNSDTGFGINGDSTTPANGYSGVMGNTGGVHEFSATYTNLAADVAGEVAGVWGDTTGNPNTGGIQDWSAGLLGTADDNNAGAFYNNSTSGDFFTIWAQSLGSSGTIGAKAGSGDAIWAESNTGGAVYASSTSGIGVYANSDSNSGVSAFSESGNAISAASSTGFGIFAQSNGGAPGTSVSGVYGFTQTPAVGSAGVFGQAYGASGTYNDLGSIDFVSGIWADSANVDDGSGNVTLGLIATTDDNEAALIANNSADSETLEVDNLAAGGSSGLFKTFKASTSDGACGIGSGGTLTCTGQLKTLATTGGGARKVETYATQSAENWMEDYGSGTIERGMGVVKIDAAFAETVSETPDYHVFLTPNADSKGLYVINKTLTSFEVRESGGGTSSLAFDYKIVAKRRGYEAQRLVDVTDRFNVEQARSLLSRTLIASPTTLVHPHQRSVRQVRGPLRNGPRPNAARTTRTPSSVRRAQPVAGRVAGNIVDPGTRP